MAALACAYAARTSLRKCRTSASRPSASVANVSASALTSSAVARASALAIYFASNGVEALRTALNRAYAVIEPRRWYWLRLESIGYTLIAAFSSLAMAFMIVLGPLMLDRKSVV